MAGKKRAAETPAPPPSANRPDVAVASIPSAKRGRGRPKSTAPTSASAAKRGPGSAAPNSAAASERAAPKPGKSEKGQAPKKKKEPQEEEGGKRKKQQAAGGAEKAAAPAKMNNKKGGGEVDPGSRKQKLSGEAAEKPAPTKKKQQASNGAEKATSPGKRKRGDASEQPKSAKRDPAGAEKPTPSKRKKKEDGEAEAKSGKKKGSPAKKAAAAAEPGSCSFPMSRVRLLMRDEDASMRATNETVFLINKASELFLEAFAKDAHQNALKERKKSIAYDNLSTSVCNEKRYKFLSDFVPLRVTAGDALKATAVDKS